MANYSNLKSTSVTFTAADFDKKAFDPLMDTTIFVHAIASPGAETWDTIPITY